MSQQQSIILNPSPHPVLSSARLRADALELLRLLCGDQWCDFYSYDPGVTMLEQQFFALTELTCRNRWPLENLFGLAVAKVLLAELEVDPSRVWPKPMATGRGVAVCNPPAAVAAPAGGTLWQVTVRRRGSSVSSGGGCRVDPRSEPGQGVSERQLSNAFPAQDQQPAGLPGLLGG